MKLQLLFPVLAAMALLNGCAGSQHGSMEGARAGLTNEVYYLPDARASRVVSVATNLMGPVTLNLVVQTQAVAVKEGGPKETVARFGEVYAFSPAFLAVHRDEPVRIRFWNLQADDNHDFMLLDPHMNVLMKVLLTPLKETSYDFTFHEEGLFNFICVMHQPSMAGQILVLPPRTN